MSRKKQTTDDLILDAQKFIANVTADMHLYQVSSAHHLSEAERNQRLIEICRGSLTNAEETLRGLEGLKDREIEDD